MTAAPGESSVAEAGLPNRFDIGAQSGSMDLGMEPPILPAALDGRSFASADSLLSSRPFPPEDNERCASDG